MIFRLLSLMSLLIVIFVLNVSFSVNGYANKLSDSSLELGINSFKEKEYWKAYSLLRPLAEQGIAEAQSIIGSMYRMGTPPTGKSFRRAFEWQAKSAMQCNPRGLVNIAGHFRLGLGVEKNEKNALRFLSLAANLGYEPAIELVEEYNYPPDVYQTECEPYSFSIADFEPSDFATKSSKFFGTIKDESNIYSTELTKALETIENKPSLKCLKEYLFEVSDYNFDKADVVTFPIEGGTKPWSLLGERGWEIDGKQIVTKLEGWQLLRLLPNKTLLVGWPAFGNLKRYKCNFAPHEVVHFAKLNNLGEKKTRQKADTNTADSVSPAELTAAQRKAERLEAELTTLKSEQQQEQQRIDSDIQIPMITASSRRESETNTLIIGKVTDNVEVAEVTVNGEPVRLSSNGSFETLFYVPRSGKVVEIVAFDSKGNRATKSIKLERGAIQKATGPVFASLNPSGKLAARNKDALALIIGVSDYERTPAKAAYADKDAQTFYDYAMLKLGIPANNIKELVNTNADGVDIRLAVNDWMARTTKQDRSDVYVFFAGHGLASDDGEKMYLLPYDGSPQLLDRTAILRDELFSDITAANPRSVTVFLDTCYSGTTRGADMLVAARPISIRAKQQNIPEGFTVFTAAGGGQTAKPLEEAKHGMFSYFLMKGMEGDADSNNDNQITAAELHQYVEQNVVQQSGGSQVPELQGDAGRVLVRFQ